MATEVKMASGKNPYPSASIIDSPPIRTDSWWRVDIPPYIQAIFFLLGILQYWGMGFLLVYGFVNDIPNIAAAASYFVHWSSVGGLIGFAVSKKGGRGSFIGGITGLILSALLMC